MLLEMKKICKDYPQGRDVLHALKDVDLQVNEGDYIAIMGRSGSGKTTLMNIIGCLDTATSGSYFLDGEDVAGRSEDQLADLRNRALGFVFQSYHLLPRLTAQENVALPLLYAGVDKKTRLERAAEELRHMGLGDKLNSRPNQLSGGQCQRVAIARAMVNRPRLLLADEPTGALDSVSGAEIMNIFSRLNEEGTTVLLITHERFIADYAKKTLYIRDGVLQEEDIYD
ncbi:MAG: ABC transporter ATP-binding protein [Ruminococcaceae bacterium]|nr:ABC transporter ATP-binding protein [Oscillospiraceae bacterium]